ncbi:hypothetical protein T02_3769 [Trichinella nativa]|uniref:Uncharacterized protein n=1 Tax=Trichinella nativa TaxID=6335 RepID=A0A0V1L5X5_9BILA|nr:hypothetical protein T02_3769 [Trichinella nativa]
MPDESPQETFPQETARRLHLLSSHPLTDSFPGRSGIGDVDLSRLPRHECYPLSRYTVWRSKLPLHVPVRWHPYVRNVPETIPWRVNSLRQSLVSSLPQPELHRLNSTASMRTSKRRPSPSDYGHTPESGPRTLGIRAPYPQTLASSVPGAFPSPLACCYCDGRGRWIWLNNRTRSLPFVESSLVLLGEPSGSVR